MEGIGRQQSGSESGSMSESESVGDEAMNFLCVDEGAAVTDVGERGRESGGSSGSGDGGGERQKRQGNGSRCGRW